MQLLVFKGIFDMEQGKGANYRNELKSDYRNARTSEI